MRPDFVIFRTPQTRRQKHTSEHLFYRIASSDYFLMSVIILERPKWKQLFIPLLCLIQLKSCNCIKIEKPPEVFCKNGVPKNFAKFIEKHLCQILFFNKIAGLSPATLLKKRLWYRYFTVNFA